MYYDMNEQPHSMKKKAMVDYLDHSSPNLTLICFIHVQVQRLQTLARQMVSEVGWRGQ